jgi:hypothetical protein
MTPDLDSVIRRVQEQVPLVKWTQAPVEFPADDDGVWFFWIPGLPGEVQIESSFGVCPFIVETDKLDDCVTANTPEDTAYTIVAWLHLPGGRPESPWHPR